VGKVVQLLRDLRRNPPDLLVSTLISRFAWLLGALAGVKDRRSWVPQWSWTMRWGGLGWRLPQPYNPRQRDVGRQDALAFCELLGVPVPETLQPYMGSPLWEEAPLARARGKLARLSRPILAVNAVAHPSIRQRQYPLGKLSQVLEELLHRGAVSSVVLLGDGHSRSAHGPLRDVLGPRALDLSGELSLPATAAALAACDAVLTVDGGLLHVALTTSLPVAALYGPTEIFSTDPRGLTGRYVALSAFDRCRCECLNHRGIRVSDECREESQCLASLPPSQVAAAVAALLVGDRETVDPGRGVRP
jgi:ADP-heptose:LPS heptosyltransferase